MLRKSINQELEKRVTNKNSVAVLFSGGMDSLSLALSCLDVGIQPTLYTFSLKSYESPDLISSRQIASLLQLPLVEVMIDDTDVAKLQEDVLFIMNLFQTKRKTAIQCIYPFLYVAPVIKEEFVLTGLCADDIYGTPRSIAKHRNTEKFDEIRHNRHNDPQSSAYKHLKLWFEMLNKTFVAPYKESEPLTSYLLGLSYKELHSPKQKYPMYKDYQDELEQHQLYRLNSNLQVGSRVREWHDELMNTSWNTGEFKTIVGLYNHVFANKENL